MDENITLDEQKAIIRNNQIYDNAVVLSNILEITSSIMAKISSDHVSRTINNDSVTKGVLLSYAASQLREKLIKTKQGVHDDRN